MPSRIYPRPTKFQDTRTRRGFRGFGSGGDNVINSVGLVMPNIFVVSGSPLVANGNITVTLANETANQVWAGPATGAAAAPGFRGLVTADLPAGTGTVTSVAMTVPSFLAVAGSPITTSGTFAVTLATETANTALLGPTSGAAAAPAFRALDPRDVAMGADALVYANPLSISTTNGKHLKTVTTTSLVGNATFNAADAGVAGQKMVFVITNDATAPETITFGTNFDANGTLVGQISKISTIVFMSDGTAWRELSRIVGVL